MTKSINTEEKKSYNLLVQEYDVLKKELMLMTVEHQKLLSEFNSTQIAIVEEKKALIKTIDIFCVEINLLKQELQSYDNQGE